MGVEEEVIERFAFAGVRSEQITFARETYSFIHPGSPDAFLEIFKQFYGPIMIAFEAAGKRGQAEDLRTELTRLFRSQNRAKTPHETILRATYLRVTVNV